MNEAYPLDALIQACHWIGQRGWAPATGGNMSQRIDNDWCLVSASGKDKGALTASDFIKVNVHTHESDDPRPPSAETGLHTLIYRHEPRANVVLHVHTINATVLSQLTTDDTLSLHGFEMQKTLRGQHSHLDTIELPIFANDQDMNALAKRIEQRQCNLEYGFLLRGHGLTCWGENIPQARRQLEGLEFLFECHLRLHALEKS